MRKGGGKAKGSAFEREICGKLSLWVSNGKQEDVFWRSAMSGGRSTVAHRKGKNLASHAGDISCTHSIGEPLTNRFFIECKAYADLNFAGLLTGKGHLVEFWKIATREATNYNKLPFLIAKQNRMPTVICLSLEGMLILMLGPQSTIMTVPKLDMYILDAEEFFKVPANVPNNR